jgi:autonomous glycyl radical cofactor GrcA
MTEQLTQSAIPADAKRIAVRPLALGEKTGHHHSLVVEEPAKLEDQVEMYEKDGQIFVRVTGEGVRLMHQEHKTHAVPEGEYRVVIQQENTDWGPRPVVD